MVCRNGKVHYSADSRFVLLTITKSGRLAEIRWSFSISESQFVRLIFRAVHIPFVCMVKFKIVAQFPVDHLANPFVSSLCGNLLHSVIMRLIFSSLSPHYLCLLFCCILSILVLTQLIIIALFCTPIKKNSVSHLRFPFRLFVAWNIHTVVFLPILIFLLFLFCWYLCCLYCFWSL